MAAVVASQRITQERPSRFRIGRCVDQQHADQRHLPGLLCHTRSEMHSHSTTAAVSATGVGIAPAWEAKEKVRKTGSAARRSFSGAAQLPTRLSR